MPGLDGTGPRGIGPMTGWGRGLCILKLPDGSGAPLTGVAGLGARPVGSQSGLRVDVALVREQIRELATGLRALQGRLDALQAARARERGGA